ncbi:hypothetical protein GCM10008927_27630 [Amylibacter ulvae]|uniref:DUF3800 domain-containing protein n=1 Tax=Paramylibacter ulvae TaxID=1651968 RepID=A0ABQ3D5Y7_9RHOB|nr:DUF3800 domain-containing protein [Amylibacter ulvae]GHA60569.1 hypothetical protein GCM10008927_27630 [Amylibacter ulvae]
MKYHFFIDESGDQGLDKIRTKERGGATEYMTMGGVLIPDTHLNRYRDKLDAIKSILKREDLHCKEMSHVQVAYFAREISKLRLQCFALISKKETLEDYKENIEGKGQAQKYYNKCSQILLERLCHFLEVEKIASEDISIKFEKMRGHNYSQMRKYLSIVREHPKDKNAALLKHIEPFSIEALDKSDEELLSIADLVAYSCYQMVNYSPANFYTPEQRYFRELKNKFWKDKDTGGIANFGLNIFKGPRQLKLDECEEQYFLKLYNRVGKK